MITTIRLSEREAAALLALADFRAPVTGTDLAAQMLRRGRDTTPAAAHQAANALADGRRGLAVKTYDGPVRYQVTEKGRELARFRGAS